MQRHPVPLFVSWVPCKQNRPKKGMVPTLLLLDATIHLASRGMSSLGAVICSWEDEGTLRNTWATKTTILWIFRARRKKTSFGKKKSSDLDHSFNGLWEPRDSGCPKQEHV